MDRDTLRQYILENYAAVNDFPWISNPTYEVFRSAVSKKSGSRSLWRDTAQQVRPARGGYSHRLKLKMRSAAFRLTARRAGLFPGLSHEQGALDKR